MLEIRDTVVQQLAGEHGAVNATPQPQTTLLKPANIKHSIVSKPFTLTVLQERVNLAPTVFVYIEKVNDHDRLSRLSTKLKQPKLPSLRL